MTPGLGEAREKLRYYSMTPEDRYAYDEHLNAVMIQNDVLDSAKLEGYLEGLAESRAENKEKGKAERTGKRRDRSEPRKRQEDESHGDRS